MDVRHRLSTLVVVCVCLFGTLFARLSYLQIVQGDALAEEAEAQLIQTFFVPANRGRIFDRRGQVLVDNRTVSVVTAVAGKLPGSETARYAVFERLSFVVGVGVEELLKRFSAIDNLEGVEIARGIPESSVLYLAEHADEFPGIVTKLDSQRVYPQGTLAAHVLGYVSDIGDDMKTKPCDARYQTGDKVGKAGIERSYECILRGMPGVTKYVVDRRNRIKETRVLAKPIAGADVYLTIDPNVQEFTEKAFDAGLRAAQNRSGYVYLGNTAREQKAGQKPFRAKEGVALVMSTVDGSILASVSRPGYDPAQFVAGISSKDYNEQYGSEAAGSPLTNRVASGRYPPGSTFKLITAISALTNGLITPNTTIEDAGSFKIPNCEKNVQCTFRNSGEKVNGKVDLRRSLVVSSDVFYYLLGYRFWTEGNWPRAGIQETAREFGFGDDTSIALPNEKSKPVPDEARKAALHESDPDIWPDGKWRTGDNLNVSIGQGEVEGTPLQLALAYAAFANGGSLYVPRIAFDTPDPLVPGTDPIEAATKGSNSTTSTSSTSSTPISSDPSSAQSRSSVETEAGTVRGRWSNGRFGPFQIDDSAPSSTFPEEVGDDGPGDPSSVDGDAIDGEGGVKPLDEYGFPLIETAQGVELDAKLRRRVDLSADVRDPILSALRGVVADEEGTANAAFRGFPLDSFPIAGKTGTAQKLGQQDYALFVAFGGPNFEYVVVVVMEQAGFGGEAAAPVARQIFNGLAGLGVGDVQYIDSKTARDR
jgi:penicillin-binding protein 2